MWYPPLLKTILGLFSASGQRKSPPKKSLRFWRLAHFRKGFLAERRACLFLQSHGLTIVERNYWTARGEIDLIVRDRHETVFIEVKFRSSDKLAPPESAVDRHKQKNIRTVAREYIRHKNLDPASCRFDIIAITHGSFWKKPDIRWLKDAFQ